MPSDNPTPQDWKPEKWERLLRRLPTGVGLDDARATLIAAIESGLVVRAEELAEARAEVEHWKGQHAEQVRRKRETTRRFAEQRARPVDWDGEVCHRCGRHNVVGFSVSDETWNAVTGEDEGVLCLACFDLLAAAKDIDWAVPGELELFPVSTVMWRTDGPISEHARYRTELEAERDSLAARLEAAERVVSEVEAAVFGDLSQLPSLLAAAIRSYRAKYPRGDE